MKIDGREIADHNGEQHECYVCNQMTLDMLPNYEVEYFNTDGLVIPDDVNDKTGGEF